MTAGPGGRGGPGGHGVGPGGPGAGDGGFSLVEMLAALTILSIVSLGLLYAVLSATVTSSDARNRVVAANLAAEAIDAARAEGREDLDAVDTRSWVQAVGTREYTLLRSATWVSGTGGTSCGASAGASLLYKRVSVQVTWADMGQTEPVRSDTVISPGVGVFDPTRGNLAVRVVDRDAAGVELVQVRLTGPSGAVLSTDVDGCAFFAGLPTGTYDVELTKADHVDPGGSSPSVLQATAIAGETVSLQADLDELASLEVTGLSTPDGSAVDPALYPLPAGLPVSLGQVSLPEGRLVAPLAGVPGTITGLYPFASGYRTWLGTCSDADPEGLDGAEPPQPHWSSPVPPPLAAVEPGSTTSVVLAGAPVEVRLRDDDGDPLVGQAVTVAHASETGTGCNSGETWSLGVTDAAGVVRATLPYATEWSLDAGDAGGPTPVTLDPADSYPLALDLTIDD